MIFSCKEVGRYVVAGTGVGAGAGEKKNPEPVKNEPAPQHWWSNVFFSTTDMRKVTFHNIIFSQF